jgi:hypothetical protein
MSCCPLSQQVLDMLEEELMREETVEKVYNELVRG